MHRSIDFRTPDSSQLRRLRFFPLLAVCCAVMLGFAGSATAHGVEPLVVDGDNAVSLVDFGGGLPGANRMVAGSDGLYQSSDGGKTWERVGEAPPAGLLVGDPVDGQVLLAGDMPACARGDGGEVLHRSEDGGASWTEVEGGEGIRPVAVWGADELALGFSCAGLVVSADAGLTWNEPIRLGPSFFEPTAFGFVWPAEDEVTERSDDEAASMPEAVLVAGTSEGGTSQLWVVDLDDPAGSLSAEPVLEFWGLGALIGYGETLMVGAADGVHLSHDGGASWELQRTGLDEVTVEGDPLTGGISEEEMARGFGINSVVFDPTLPETVYLGTFGGISVSTDGGVSWAPVGDLSDEVFALALIPETATMLAQTAGAVMVVPNLGDAAQH